MELLQIQILTRHGARTPVTNIPDVSDFPHVVPAFWDKNVFEVEKPELTVSLKAENGEALKESEYEKVMLSRGLLQVWKKSLVIFRLMKSIFKMF